jgi:hypothetical protein
MGVETGRIPFAASFGLDKGTSQTLGQYINKMKSGMTKETYRTSHSMYVFPALLLTVLSCRYDQREAAVRVRCTRRHRFEQSTRQQEEDGSGEGTARKKGQAE